jgi:Leucine-rich repeat (LRR) protein
MNELINLPELSHLINLQELDCKFNKLIYLQQLPINLKTLICEYNQLTSLPELPNTLQQLHSRCNETILPSLYIPTNFINQD